MKIKQKEWSRPEVIPEPEKTDELNETILSINGKWKFIKERDDNFHKNSVKFDDWEDIDVPEDVVAKYGFGIKKYGYKKIINIPDIDKDKRIFLSFESINGFAKVYIDGKFVCEHKNGLIRWNCEITDFVTPNQKSVLSISVDDEDDVSTFNKGGIIRDAKILVLPTSYISRLHVRTEFDKEYNNAKMIVMTAVEGITKKDLVMKLRLISPTGDDVKLDENMIDFSSNTKERNISLKIKSPIKWDAEHPELYTLVAQLEQSGTVIEKVKRTFGFRQIEIRGNIMYVNGKEVKLRGVCRSVVSAHHGMATGKELVEKDVKLFKEANINYIRTAHYPASEYFLDLCDKYGIYVENEVGLAFISRTLKYSPRNPAKAKRYLGFFSEFMERDLSHPSVIMWSLANESFYGPNFSQINDYAHKEDPTRPTKFSYPMTMQEEDNEVDIWSIHYSNLDADLARKNDNVSVGYSLGYDKPVIHDEYIHVPCYNRTEHKHDIAVRGFWGESIKRFWDKIWNTKGALGGAIWAGIDAPENYLEWGLIDIWRRRKPEHWMTRKAYSPIRIEKTRFEDVKDKNLEVEIENRFCHTNMNEVQIIWKVNGKQEHYINDLNIEPGKRGKLSIPYKNWTKNNQLSLEFKDYKGNIVDEFILEINSEKESLEIEGNRPGILETESEFLIKGDWFELSFSKETGLINYGNYKNKIVLKSGPYLNMPPIKLSKWELNAIKCSEFEDGALLEIKGQYGNDVWATFNLTIYKNGIIDTKYTIDKLNVDIPKAMKIRVGVDGGGLNEIGVYYIVDSRMNNLSWKREGLWTTYPDYHICRNKGETEKFPEGISQEYNVEPKNDWGKDTKSFILYDKYDDGLRGCNDFISGKHNIIKSKLTETNKKGSIMSYSDGTDSVRMEIIPDEDSMIDATNSNIDYVGNWYLNDDPNCYLGTEMMSNTKGDYAEFSFEGTAISLISSVDVINGLAKVYIDDKLMDDKVNLRVEGVEFPGASIGYDKRYGKTVYSISGLEDKKHKIKIEVLEKNAGSQNNYVNIDAFRIVNKKYRDNIKFIVNNDYNFPRISWGNYHKEPIIIKEGYTNNVRIQITK